MSNDAPSDSGTAAHDRDGPGAPLWFKIFAAVALVVVVALAVLLLTGRGQHGPGRHTSTGDGRQSPPPGLTHAGPPSGVHTQP